MASDLQERVESAWAELAGLVRLSSRDVIVRPTSMLGRAGWIAVVQLPRTLTVAAPTPELAEEVRRALDAVPSGWRTAEQIAAALPRAVEVLGPATLFYRSADAAPEHDSEVARVGKEALRSLQAALPESDFDESGLEDVTSDLFVVHDASGRVAAACGYELWPAGIAHFSVATAPAERRRGAGRKVARAAIESALDEGLLPQWRARPEPSKRLARSLGFQELGLQMSVRLG